MRRNGFTLVELLVVLAIAGLIIGVAAPMVARGFPGVVLETAADSIEQSLRVARSTAISRNSETIFRLDVEARTFGADGARRTRTLPEDIGVRLVVGDQEVTDASTGGIRFFPDGSSTGGRIELTLAGRSARVDVDWLTGRIRVGDPWDDDDD